MLLVDVHDGDDEREGARGGADRRGELTSANRPIQTQFWFVLHI